MTIKLWFSIKIFTASLTQNMSDCDKSGVYCISSRMNYVRVHLQDICSINLVKPLSFILRCFIGKQLCVSLVFEQYKSTSTTLAYQN